MNDRERERWVRNDEGLHNYWESTRLSMTRFLCENRAELDRAIENALSQEPNHQSISYPARGALGRP